MILHRTLVSITAFMAVASVVCTAQNLQAGVSVNLPVVSNATAVPEADRGEALIVTVTEDGVAYLGTEPVSADVLRERLRGIRLLSLKKLYIKADAHARYGDVERVLIAAKTAGAQNLVLLAAQRETPQPGVIAPPRGFQVSVGFASASGSQSSVLELLSSGQESPTLLLNDQRLAWTDLPSAVERLPNSRGTPVVRLRADGVLPFSEVVRAIDLTRSVGADVVLLIPQA